MNQKTATNRPSLPKLAIIGSGIAGLSANYFLSTNYDITIFEKEKSLGMGKSGFQIPEFQNYKFDIPLRIFNRAQYPFLSILLTQAGLKSRILRHDGIITNEDHKPLFDYRNVSWLGREVPVPVFGKGSSLNSLRHFFYILKMKSAFERMNITHQLHELTLREFLNYGNISGHFRDQVFLPIFASICTCSYDEILDYPAKTLIECFFNFKSGKPFERFIGGTTAIENMLSNYTFSGNKGKSADLENDKSRVILGANIKGISIRGDSNQLVIHTEEEKNEDERFDYLIFATEASAAADLTPIELDKHLLRKIPYTKAISTVHRDSEILGACERPSLVYQTFQQERYPFTTMNLNKVEPELSHKSALYQTLNFPEKINSSKILKSATMTRPLQTPDSLKVVKKLFDTQFQRAKSGLPKVFYVGSYLWPTLPLLETGVCSSWYLSNFLGAVDKEFQSAFETHYRSSQSWFFKPS